MMVGDAYDISCVHCKQNGAGDRAVRYLGTDLAVKITIDRLSMSTTLVNEEVCCYAWAYFDDC